MKLNRLGVRFYKTGAWISEKGLTGAEARLFYQELCEVFHNFKILYKNKIDGKSLLTCVDGEEIYRMRSNLNRFGIKTIADLLEYLDVENPKYIVTDNEIVNRTDIKLSRIDVLEIYTSMEKLNNKEKRRIAETEVNYGTI